MNSDMPPGDKAAAFKALHHGPGCFVIANPWDRGSARMLAKLGFKALATTSVGFDFSSGRPEGDLSAKRNLPAPHGSIRSSQELMELREHWELQEVEGIEGFAAR